MMRSALVTVAIFAFGVSAALAAPAAAQDRVGWCYLNVGQMVGEPAYHVRTGNMGNENACAFADFDLGSDFYASGMVAYTQMFIWPVGDEPISRWSWRPRNGRQEPFLWLNPHIGYRATFGPVSIRPNVGLWWPAGTSHTWGAPVGVAPSVGMEASVQVWKFEVGVMGWLIRKGPDGWTVLHDWAGGGVVAGETFYIWPVLLKFAVRP